MRGKNFGRHGPIQLLAELAALLALACAPAAAADLRVDPGSIGIGSFFSGASVHVSGKIPKGSRAVVEVIGKRIEEQLLRKGRHWEIWMSVGEIDIEGAPNLYFALSTDPTGFSGLDADAEYGYAALKRRAYFRGDTKGMGQEEILRRFIALKEEENLYRQSPGALKVTETPGDAATVEGSFRIPSRVAPGEYRVRLSIVDHGRLLHSETAPLAVRMQGLPAFLSDLSRRRGAVFGLFAVAIAVVFGFFVGVAFRKRRAH